MRIIPVVSDGWRFIIPFGLAGVFFIWLGYGWAIIIGALCVILAFFCLFFFRDFNRFPIPDDSIIYSSGDGKVLGLETIQDGELAGWQLVRIFLSVFDGHIQRAPMAGTAEKIIYQKGRFLDARHPRAHLDNEQNTVTFSSPKGTVVVKQIAGLIARRVVCWIKEGDSLSQGERYGLIRFGSQVDMMLPPHAELMVRKGDKILGGKTVLARWPT